MLRHLFIPILFLTFSIYAQEKYVNVDSLLERTTQSDNYIEKAKFANLIAEQLNAEESYAVALEYSKSAEGFIVGDNSKEALTVLIEVKKQQGIALTNIGDYSGALKAYIEEGNTIEKLLSKEKKSEQRNALKKKQAQCFNDRGVVHLRQHNLKDAENSYINALKILSEVQDQSGMALCYNNFGNLMLNYGDPDSALSYYGISLEIREKLQDKKGISGSYNNIGICYQIIGRIHLQNEDHEEAKENIWIALDYFSRSLDITKELGNRFDIARTSINLGRFYAEFQMYEEAETHLLESINYCQEIGASDRLKNAYETMAYMYEDRNIPELALYYHKLYKDVNDSLNTFQERTQLSMLEAKAALDKQQEELRKERILNIERAKQRNDNLQTILWISLSGLVIVISLTGFLFNRFRVISKQKDLIEQQNTALEGANNEIKKQNKKITSSIDYAKTIQNAILGSKDINILGDHFLFFQPKDVVSGDFYWSHAMGDKVIWTVADCTGHGVPGALMSMIGTSLLNEVVIEKGITDAHKILSELKELLIKTLGQSSQSLSRDGMDISLCVLNKSTNELQFAGANNPMYLIRNQFNPSDFVTSKKVRFYKEHLIEFRGDKQSISFEEGKSDQFDVHAVKVLPGDIIVNITDGYPDQFGGPDNKKLSYPRLKDLLLDIKDLDTDQQLLMLTEQFYRWKGNEDQIDDICILGVKI